MFEFTVFHTTPPTLSTIGALMIASSAIYTTAIFPVFPLTDLMLTGTHAQLTKQTTTTKPSSGISERSVGGTSASDRDDDQEA